MGTSSKPDRSGHRVLCHLVRRAFEDCAPLIDLSGGEIRKLTPYRTASPVPEVAGVDFAPLIVGEAGEGGWAVDVRIVIGGQVGD